MFRTESYKTVAQTKPSDDDETEIERLSSIVQNLQNQINTMREDVTSTVTKSVMKDVDTKIQAVEDRVNERINDIELKWDGDMKALVKRLAIDNQHILNAIHGKSVTPSGDIDARGGAK